MELPPPRSPSQPQSTTPSSPRMAAVAVGAPALLPSPGDMIWRGWRDVTPKPRPQKIELPSIRQLIPEIDRAPRGHADVDYRPDSAFCSPTALIPPPEYVESPGLSKRRRLSTDEDDPANRDHGSSRFFRSPPRAYQSNSTTVSPRADSRRASIISVTESWASSTRTSPHIIGRGAPTIRLDPFSTEWRPRLPSLPSLPTLTLGEGPPPPRQVPRAMSSWGDYAFDGSGARPAVLPSSPVDPPPGYYSYQQPRGLSYSGPATHDRMPFSHAPFGGYPYGVDSGEHPGDGKQRKRRGNLPKETTDKLRMWFVNHLNHPYPTEDEKQDLMRQTGLQMNQISNWFINARRRQLPAMINNARAESDVKTSQAGDIIKTAPETAGPGGSDENRKKSPSLGFSEAEAGPDYEHDILARMGDGPGMAKRGGVFS